MVGKPDAGPIVAQEPVPIGTDDDRALAVSHASAAAAARLLAAHPATPRRGAARRHVPWIWPRAPTSAGADPRTAALIRTGRARGFTRLIRAVAPPFPGAFIDLARRARDLRRLPLARPEERAPATCTVPVCGGRPLYLDCSDGLRLQITGLIIDARPLDAQAFSARYGDSALTLATAHVNKESSTMKKLLILGVNGFIGHHLSEAVIRETDWDVYGMDLESDRLANVLAHPRFHFFEGDITINREWVEYHIRKCDMLLPLVAIATPATYISDPLRVFELDFEANLPLIRQCVKHSKRVVFPSTSEIYGMSTDREFHPYDSHLVLGPMPKSRWIYSCSKQLLDRVIWAYGEEGSSTPRCSGRSTG